MSNFRGADLSFANLEGSTFKKCDFSRANLYQANVKNCDFSGSDMTCSYLRGTNFTGSKFWFSTIRNAMAKTAYFIDCELIGLDVLGAFLLGSVWWGSDKKQLLNADRAIWKMWLNPDGGKPSYEPVEGWTLMERSHTGPVSFQENAARRYGEP